MRNFPSRQDEFTRAIDDADNLVNRRRLSAADIDIGLIPRRAPALTVTLSTRRSVSNWYHSRAAVGEFPLTIHRFISTRAAACAPQTGKRDGTAKDMRSQADGTHKPARTGVRNLSSMIIPLAGSPRSSRALAGCGDGRLVPRGLTIYLLRERHLK